MSYTTDEGKLFQTDAQHEKSAIRAVRSQYLSERGQPIKLATKPIRLVVREQPGKEAEAWVAESGFVVRRVGLESGKTKQIYRGHGGPVTSVAFYTTGGPDERELLISGSWDKSFRIWDLQTKAHVSTNVGHIDFVKTLTVIPSLKVLVTGSSDKDIRIWDLSPLDSLDIASITSSAPRLEEEKENATPAPQQTGAAPPPASSLRPLKCLFALKAHSRPIEQFVSYPLLEPLPEGVEADEVDIATRRRTGKVALLSADSMGAVKVWELRRDERGEVKGELRCEVRHHELGIYDMQVGPEGELWTASADNSVLLSHLSLTSASEPPVPTLRIPHPAQTRSILPLPLSSLAYSPSAAPHIHYLLTGSSDELIRIFDLSDSSLDPSPSREQKRDWRGIALDLSATPEGCVKEIEGHTHEIVQLCAYTTSSGEAWILSASLDGTLRRWKWPDVLREKVDKLVIVPVEEEEPKKESLLTEEEERELAELMGEE
ncbi:WD repeat-containing protein 49 [Rhodotorula toruloides]|uniref:WD40-repeat-containing domain protein n=1 Tax=Rhodotorula toruloides TaxID=5286 RepID=A0A2T0A4U2_RHOTO|nr:WD40-repeat-containing domain protein [Rhodotorula toruloides]